MTTKRISVNVGGLWRTNIDLKEDATWFDYKAEVGNATCIYSKHQHLTPDMAPDGDIFAKCELEDGDDIFCDWQMEQKKHPLHEAAYYGENQIIRSWLASGADIDVEDCIKNTPLMIAACSIDYYDTRCVHELLQLGANACHKNIYDDTSLHRIAYYYDSYCAQEIEIVVHQLISAGCDPMMRNIDGDTAVDIVKKRFDDDSSVEFDKMMNVA
jgi:hypothetical protein